MKILALNCGSSSLKYQLVDWQTDHVEASGLVERIGTEGAHVRHRDAVRRETRLELGRVDHTQALARVLELLGVSTGAVELAGVGHRVVHGGSRFAGSVRITPEVVRVLEELVPLAPLHNPANLAGIQAISALLPSVPQVAVFDTAFHQTMPARAYTYGVPRQWIDELGVRSYGFHGTSHLYVSRRAASLLGRPLETLRMITCHVGNGVSLSAIQHGSSIDNSMGLTPLEGAMMGTRSGDLDAGILPYVHARTGQDFPALFETLNRQSGMLGLTGHGDLREVEAGYQQGDTRCVTALNAYCYRLRKYVGAYAAAMGGVDAVVFTAGVGENSPLVRSLTLEGLEFLGIQLEPAANARTVRGAEGLISPALARVPVLVVPTNEERVIVEDVVALLGDRSPADPAFHYTFEAASAATRA